MLISFCVKNYKSILDLTVPLVYGEKKAPNGYKEMDYFPFLEEFDVRVIPTLALYGKNASGKSNIIKALSELTSTIKTRYKPELVIPNKLHPDSDASSFELKFISEGALYHYILGVDGTEICTEILFKNDKKIFAIADRGIQFTQIATGVYSYEKLKERFYVESFDQDIKFRVPFLSVLGKNYAGLNHDITSTYQYLTKKLEIHHDTRLSFMTGLERLSSLYDRKDSHKVFTKIVSMLKKFDIEIERMEHKQEIREWPFLPESQSDHYENRRTPNGIVSTEIYSYHKSIEGSEVRFNFKEESEGTQRVACLLGYILYVLETGGVLIVDELEASLHPLMLREIVKMFKDKRYNISNAQLIFTTHNTDIMEDELMRVSEVGFVHKTLKEGTTLTRLSDFEGVRNVTNFRKQYLAGTYSGIPFPYI